MTNETTRYEILTSGPAGDTHEGSNWSLADALEFLAGFTAENPGAVVTLRPTSQR